MTDPVSVPGLPPNLRERKKHRTRLAIRQEAFRLFAEQGYANTTIEQIADAADVSPRTFYRYFGVKEQLLMSDDHSAPIVEAFATAPAEMSIVEAYRHGITQVFGQLTPDEREDAITGQRLLYEVPEARSLIYSEYVRLIDLITDALPARPDAPSDAFERRVIAGAIAGVLMAISHDTPLPENDLMRALSVLDARMR